MPRIKVVGYIELEEEDEHFDSEDDTGLTSDGYEYYTNLLELDNPSFELVA